MYTIIWTEEGHDKWDRVKSKAEVHALLDKIRDNPAACPVGDVWIFSPKADDYASAGDEFEPRLKCWADPAIMDDGRCGWCCIHCDITDCQSRCEHADEAESVDDIHCDYYD